MTQIQVLLGCLSLLAAIYELLQVRVIVEVRAAYNHVGTNPVWYVGLALAVLVQVLFVLSLVNNW